MKLIDAALVLLIFGEVEIVIEGASVKPNVKLTGRGHGKLENKAAL